MDIKIFTDGASRGNPGAGGWGAIVIWGGEVKELGGRQENTTNNRMELTAVIKALEFLNKLKIKNLKLKIYLDSSYVLKGGKIWVFEWQKNKWKTKQKKEVINVDLWKKFLKISKNSDIEWTLLSGHSGIPANERCDQIATTYADKSPTDLFSGKLLDYKVDVLSLATPQKINQKIKRVRSGKPYSYVSVVGNVVSTYGAWEECEKVVKGVSGAKFKKVFSKEEEGELISKWKNGSEK